VWWRKRYCRDDWLQVGRVMSINSAFAIIGLLMVMVINTDKNR